MPLDNWLWALLFFAAWIFIAVMNARCAWRHYVRKQTDGPTVLPFAGAAAAFLFLLALPAGDGNLRLALIWPFIILDVGSLPYLLVGSVVLVGRALRHPRETVRQLTAVPSAEERAKEKSEAGNDG